MNDAATVGVFDRVAHGDEPPQQVPQRRIRSLTWRSRFVLVKLFDCLAQRLPRIKRMA